MAALLDLIEIEADPVKSPEWIFFCQLLELKWRAGQPVSLESMIRELMDPKPEMRMMGAMDTETMLPRGRRGVAGGAGVLRLDAGRRLSTSRA